MKRYRLPALLTGALIALLAIIAVNMSLGGGGTLAEENAPIFEYPDYPPTPTVDAAPQAQVVLQGASPASGTTLFAESFDTPASLSNWQVVDLQQVIPEERSDWAVREGRLVQDRTVGLGDPRPYETAALTGDASWADYTITAKFYDAANGTFGLIARADGSSYYRYRVYTDAFTDLPTRQVLEKVVDGVATTLATVDGAGYAQREWNTAALRVSGPEITVWLNGQLVMQATDSDLTSGKAGVASVAIGDLYVDDVTVTAP